jgi:hypothetical protein
MNEKIPPEFMKLQIALYIFYVLIVFFLILVGLVLMQGSLSMRRWRQAFAKKVCVFFSIYNKKRVSICRQFSPAKEVGCKYRIG